MCRFLVPILLITLSLTTLAQKAEKPAVAPAEKSHVRIYDDTVDAMAALDAAVARAGVSRRHVLVQVGGNWCPWCIKFHTLCSTNARIDSLLRADYEVVLVNYSRENQNREAMKRLGYPQRFGFPVFVVLDGRGLRLHTQDSGFLEGGSAHDPEKVLTFLRSWTPGALDPDRYR